MAEFAEVIRQWKRMCEAQFECDRCPVDKIGCCGNVTSLSKDVEKTVMSWASEHPVLYPTWYEYLTDLYNSAWDDIYAESIPADIAEKLGVKPKE